MILNGTQLNPLDLLDDAQRAARQERWTEHRRKLLAEERQLELEGNDVFRVYPLPAAAPNWWEQNDTGVPVKSETSLPNFYSKEMPQELLDDIEANSGWTSAPRRGHVPPTPEEVFAAADKKGGRR